MGDFVVHNQNFGVLKNFVAHEYYHLSCFDEVYRQCRQKCRCLTRTEIAPVEMSVARKPKLLVGIRRHFDAAK